jgi:hypothetical protein
MILVSGMLLGATVIAGFLTVSQLRQATDIKNSTKAIFAADAGVELEKYRWYKDRMDCHGIPNTPVITTITTPATAPMGVTAPWPPTAANPGPIFWSPSPYPLGGTSSTCHGYDSDSMNNSPNMDGEYLIDGAKFKPIIFYKTKYNTLSGAVETVMDHVRVIGKSGNSARAIKATF